VLNGIERRMLLRDFKDQQLFWAASSATASREYPIFVPIAIPLWGSVLHHAGFIDSLDQESQRH
jgi:hypothetical protein